MVLIKIIHLAKKLAFFFNLAIKTSLKISVLFNSHKMLKPIFVAWKNTEAISECKLFWERKCQIFFN